MGEENKVNGYVLAYKKGEESERKVCQALEELKAEGMIKNFGQSLKFYQEDSSGRDVLITTNNDKVIWLQVKSSFSPLDKKKYSTRGIYYLAVQQKSPSEIKTEVLRILKQGKKTKKRPRLEERIKAQI